MADWRAHWAEQNPAPKRNVEEYQERFKREHEAQRQSVLPGVEAKRPERLGQYDTRQLIRATKMLIHRPNPERFPGEDQKVLMEPVELFDETLTVWQIHEKYNLYDIRPAMEKLSRKNPEALLRAVESQSEQLSGIHEQLVYLRSDMGD
jgi:hypothetical protein